MEISARADTVVAAWTQEDLDSSPDPDQQSNQASESR
jgi:hypothetical protein